MLSKSFQLWILSSVLVLATACSRSNNVDENQTDASSHIPNAMRAVMKAATPNVCATAEENANASISCPSGQVISDVVFASYGLPHGSCGGFSVNASCNAANSLSAVKSACLGKSSCAVNASNNLFGDPCYGANKSLSIQVTCADTGSPSPVPTPTPATPPPASGNNVCGTAAEHTSLNLTCPSGQKITQVVFASYGTASGTCGSYKVGSCNANNSVSFVQAACVGKTSCVVAADNGAFGDPCAGTQKSLTVQALCGGSAATPTPTSTPVATVTPKPTATPQPTPSQGPGSGSWSYDLDSSHSAFALYAQNDSGALVATPTSSGAKPYAFAIYNEYGTKVANLSAVAQSNGTYRYTLPTDRLGYFEIRPAEGNASSLIPAVGSRPAGMITYAVLKKPDTNPTADFQDEFTSIQGTTMENGADYLGTGTFAWLGYTTYGVSYYSWNDCSPNQASAAQDCANHLANDPVVTIFKNKKMMPLFYMNEMPMWAVNSSNGSTFGAPPKDMNQWRAHLERVVPAITSRYGFLPYRKYQMTWEPNDGWGWYGTDDQFIQLYQIAYEVIKKYDANGIIMGPTITNFGPEMKSQFQRLLGKGLGKYMNAISWHPYPSLAQIYDYNSTWIADFRAIANQSMGRTVPLYLTESGLSDYEMGLSGNYPVNSNFGVFHAVGNVAMALTAKNDGASLHTYFYTADFSGLPHYGIFYNATVAYSYGPNKVQPKPDVPMIRQANDLLNHSDGVGRLVNPAGNTNLRVYYYRNKHSGVYTAVLWDPSGNNGSIALPVGASQVTVKDAHGNAATTMASNGVLSLKLGIAPTYVEGISSSALTSVTPSAPIGTP